MPDIYAWPGVNDTTGLNELASYVQGVSDGLFFPLILLGIYVIIFVVTTSYGIGKAFTFASFFTSVLAIFFAVAGLINQAYVYLLFVLLGIGLLILRIAKSSQLQQI